MTSAHVTGVLDLTFLDIKEEADLTNALSGDRVQNMATTISLAASSSASTSFATSSGQNNGSNNDTSPRKKQPEEIKAIRIANNSISTLQILINPFSSLFDTTKVTWLDISFNQIDKINTLIFDIFPNLTALYLQANTISRLSEIKKLEKFPYLKSLAIYGNPVEEHKHYRNYVLFFCKVLTNFDMSPVTKSERTMNDIWSQTFRKKLYPEND